jgi:hypothetical protein
MCAFAANLFSDDGLMQPVDKCTGNPEKRSSVFLFLEERQFYDKSARKIGWA